ncbi:hypothetical protein VU04_00780 [Desulfobulbus sp. TB]|nr:hypothetical protein [Desulfobulbus sp. TB]
MKKLLFEGITIPEYTLSELLIQEARRMLLSVGTWCSTILCLLIISVLAGFMEKVGSDEPNALNFYIPLTYSVGLSMLITAPLNGLLSHRLAEELWKKNYEPLVNSLNAALTVLLPSIFILAFLMHQKWASSQVVGQGVIFAVLTVSMSALWICNNVMTLLHKDYGIIITFMLGLFLAILGTSLVSDQLQGEGVLGVLSLGFTLTAFLQYGYIIKEYKNNWINPCYKFIRVNKENLMVFLFFIFFNFGMWIDKILYWFVDDSNKKLIGVLGEKKGVEDQLFHYSDYDYPFFVVFTLFSISQFLILRKLKELLKKPQQGFSDGLFFNLPFKYLDKEKHNLILGYRKIMYSLFSIYGSIILIILFSVSVDMIPLPWHNPYVFHILLISTLILGIFFLNLIILQYTDQYKPVALLCGFFLLANGLGTFLTIKFYPDLQGLGFLIASFSTAVFSSIYVERILGRWEYVVIKNIANNF